MIAAGGGLVVRAGEPGPAAPTRRHRGVPRRVAGVPRQPGRQPARSDRCSTAPSPPREVLTRLHAERAALYAEVADLTVDVEPFHATEEKPKRAMAERIAELVLAHEAKVSA